MLTEEEIRQIARGNSPPFPAMNPMIAPINSFCNAFTFGPINVPAFHL